MIHAGKFKDTYYVLDVESGSLHELDRAAYEVALLLEQGIAPKDSKETREILSEFQELKDKIYV